MNKWYGMDENDNVISETIINEDNTVIKYEFDNDKFVGIHFNSLKDYYDNKFDYRFQDDVKSKELLEMKSKDYSFNYKIKNDLPYRFKIYFNDGTVVLGGARSKNAEGLYFDFDGLMDWDDYYKLDEMNLSTKEVLELAFKVYKNLYKKEYYRIEIINDKTNEVVDYIQDENFK